MIPPDCTSKSQLMDICISKSFKAILQNCWVEYVPEMINKEHVQLPTLSYQHMVDWVEKVKTASQTASKWSVGPLMSVVLPLQIP